MKDMLERIGELVAIESPTADRDACRTVQEHCALRYKELGAAIEWTDGDDGTPVLLARFGSQQRPGLVVGHVDTVFPHGELSSRPFTVHDGLATGPGVLDMKAGLALLEYAIAALDEPPNLTVLLNADEETGSAGSQSVIRTEAVRGNWALILEPATADGAVKSARKGIGMYDLTVTGRAAHPGLDFAAGVNAAVEAAHQTVALAALTDDETGTTVNIGLIEAGTGRNVVPASARVAFESRFWTAVEAARVDEAVHGLAPVDQRAALAVSGGIHKPPMERDAGAAALIALAAECAEECGFMLAETAVGGVSDGNVTAGVGVPTLDGMGAVGAGAHGVDEYVDVASLPARARWLSRLLTKLPLLPTALQ
jgi:glutamate carboxypeptidase